MQRGVAGSRALAHAASSNERAWVTVYKRDTSINSYYLTTDSAAGATTLDLNAIANDICANTQGCLLLVGGTTEKEFMSAAAPATTTTLTVDNAVTEATNAQPYVTTRQYAHETGDSVVQYKCNWQAPAAVMSAATTSALAENTQGGVNARAGSCLQTSLIGLTVIPMPASPDGTAAAISPGDFVRIEFPKDMESTPATVEYSEEEIYRVNAVTGSSLVVTPKPLATANALTAANGGAAARIPVNQYQGGSTLDVLRYMGAITFTVATSNGASSTSISADATHVHTVTASSTQNLFTDDYCLVDKEFFKIGTIDSGTKLLTFPARGNGNVGRASFGTTAVAHSRGGSGTAEIPCDIYRISSATQQAAPGVCGECLPAASICVRVCVRVALCLRAHVVVHPRPLNTRSTHRCGINAWQQRADVCVQPSHVDSSTQRTVSGRACDSKLGDNNNS